MFVWSGPSFVLVHKCIYLCLRAANTLTRLRRCAGSSENLLHAIAIMCRPICFFQKHKFLEIICRKIGHKHNQDIA